MGRSIAWCGVRLHTRMDDLCGRPPGIDRLRDSNGEVEELGAGALFPARVESHRSNDSIRNKSEISCRLPRDGALVAAAVETRELCPTVRKFSCEREVGSACSGNDRAEN